MDANKDPPSLQVQNNERELRVPLHLVLRSLALKPTSGESLFPSSWSSLQLSDSIQIDASETAPVAAAQGLQHEAVAVFDKQRKKWQIRGSSNKFDIETLGVVASKQHGARAIQLPNQTNKIVAGVIDGNELVNLFAAPQISGDGSKIAINPSGNSRASFLSVVPAQNARVSSQGSARQINESAEEAINVQTVIRQAGSSGYDQHFQYTLQSKKVEKTEGKEQVKRSKLVWSDDKADDVVDLGRMKDYLIGLRGEYESDPEITNLPGMKREEYDQRLLLLEHQIDGLLKRKINFTSVDSDGTRFLDYTTIINDKENEIIGLNKKIQNLEARGQGSKKREEALNKEIKRLSEALSILNAPGVSKEQVADLLILNSEAVQLNRQAANYKKKMDTTGNLLRSHMKDLKLKGVKVENEDQINRIVEDDQNVDITVNDGMVQILENRQKIIEKPMQDERTQEMIRQMAGEINRIYTKYPKVKKEADPRFVDLLNQNVVKTVDNDGLSKIIEIVKHNNSVVKVENVYSYNADKQRRVEFHQRILLKSLLQEFQKMKLKTGYTPELDEKVITMINEEIKDTADVEDIMKCFQVNHKIVEVPKIVEKVVERVVEVPTVIPIERTVEKVVTNTKIQEVEKIVHVPVEIIKYVDKVVEKIVEIQVVREKLVEVPKYIEKIVEKRVEVPKICEVEVIRQKIVEVDRPVIVEKIVNQPVPEIQQVEVCRQQTVVVKEVEEKIVEVDRCVQKIVERVVEKPVMIEVERIVEKIVHTVEYKTAKQTINHIEKVPQIIERIVEKIVPVIQTVEKIKQVTKIVERIVEVKKEVPTIKEIKVIEERIVFQDRIKEVEKIVEKVVPLCQEVQKIVERKVEVPMIQEKIVTVTEVVEKIVPQLCEQVKMVEVEKIVERVVEVTKIVQVPKTIIKYIKEEVPVKVIVEKTIEIPKIVEKIKEVRVYVDKIIQKMVEVPKVVEVQKIVEKIVVVPRIIEKIVEVPQIVEKIVDRIVEVEKIVEIIKEIKVPITVQKIIEVQKIVNVPVIQYKTIEVIREKIVPAIQIKEVIKEIECLKEKVVQVIKEVPKEFCVDKIITCKVEVEKIVEVQKAMVIPFQVPVPCEKVIEKIVVVQKEVEKIKEVTKTVEKIVQVIKEVASVKQVTKIEQKPVIHQTIKEVERQVPYITEKIKEVEVIREKPVATNTVEERLVEVTVMQDKIVSVRHEVPKIYEVEKVVEKIVEVPKFVEITTKEPVFVNVNQFVDKIVEKAVHTNTVEQRIKEVPTIKEKIVTIEKCVPEIRQVEVNRDKIVEKDNFITKTDTANKIEIKHQQVHTKQDKLVPVAHSTEKLVEVPHIMEKVVERIVLMSQVHEVSKHIIDIQEESHPGVAVDVDFQEHEAQYQKLYGGLKKDTDSLIIDLRTMQKNHPELRDRLRAVESYMVDLDKVIAHPKIIQVNNQKIVEKTVLSPVMLRTEGKMSQKDEAFYLVLIEKYEKQLKQAQRNNNYQVADQDIKRIFFGSTSKEEDMRIKDKIAKYKQSEEGAKLYGKSDNALVSSIIYDKYKSISQTEKANQEANRYKKFAEERLELLHQFKQTNQLLHQRLLNLEERVRQLSRNQGGNKENVESLKILLKEIEDLDEMIYNDIRKTKISEPVQTLRPGNQFTTRLQETKMRELEAQVETLKGKLIDKQGRRVDTTVKDKTTVIQNLQIQISRLMYQKGQSQHTLPGTMENLESGRYSPVKPGDTPWDPYGPPPPGADVSKYEVKKPGDTPWDPYGPPPPGADVSKYEVKKPGDTPWDPYGPPPPGADVSKYEVKKPGDTPWDPYGPPPPGADVSKYEVKKPGDTPWDPYGPPPPGADVSKYEVKKPGDTPWDPYGPPPPGSAQVQAALKKLGTVTGPLSLYLKPGFYGQIFVPIVDLDVLDSYYATPQTRQRPSLFADVVTNSSSYYPNPTSSQTRDKKAIFEYGMPLCIPKTTQLIMDPANTFYPRNFQDQAYSYDKYHGYMSIPIGTPDFMVGTQVAGNLSNAPFIQYNHALPQSNTFQSPTLIDPTKASQAIFRYTGNTNNIKGHLVIPVFKAGQVNKWYQTVDQSGKRAPPTEPVNNQLQKQVVYVPAGQPHEVYSHSKLSTNDTQGYIVMPMGIPDYINWRYNNGPVNHLVPFDYRIVYDPIGRPFQVKDDQTFIEFMETAAGHRSSYFWAKTVYRRHNKRSKCIWLEPDGKFRRSRFRYIWPMAYYNVTEELGSAKETTAIARPGDTPWDPYGPPPPGDTPWDPYGPPPPGADVSKYEVKKPGDTPWDPYGPPPPGADVSKYEVKKPGDTPWDPYGPPPPGADVSKYEVKKPGDTPWDPYGPPPPGADVSKYEVKKPGDTPWDPYGPPPPGADVSKYEVKKPGDTPWDPYGPPPPGADVSKYEVKKPGDTPWDPYGPPPPGSAQVQAALKKLGTVTGPLSLYLKPGFYGQIFVPIVDLDVLDSYYATPQTRQRPSLFADVVTNSSSYYPNPTSSQTRDKKAIFEYGMPLCIPKTTQLIMDPANTFYPRNFQDQAYSYDKYHGYMSIPIGTPDFMVGTQVAGNLSNAPFIQYNHALPQSNTFQSPTLIDPTKASQAIFRYTGNTNNIKGHLVIPVFKAGQVNKWYQTVDQSGKRAPPTEPVNNQLQKQVVYVPAGQPHEVYSHSKLSTNDTQGYIVMPMGIPDYINWRYNNGPVNHLVPFDYRIVYDPIGRPFQVKDDQTFIEFMETAAGHRSSYFWAKTVYRRHNKRSKCIWLEPDGKFRRSRFRYIWPMAYYNVTEELGSAKETTAIARPGDTPWDPYGPPPPGDTPWDPYGPPPPGADVSKYEVKKPGDTPWDPYGPPPPGADVSKYEVKKPGDTPWDPYGPPPPGADVSKYEVKKPGDTPWDPYGPPPPGADVSKYEVKKPGDTPWDPYGPPPPGADVSKYEVKKPGDTPWDPYGPPPPGADVSKYEVKKPGDTPWDPYGPPPPGADVSKYEVKKPGDTPWDPYGPPPPGADVSKYEVKKPGDTPWDPYGPPPPGSAQVQAALKKLGTVTGPLSLYLKPGFYGQIFVPIVDLDVLDSYYATPQTRQRPSLFADVVTNSSSYYPNPTSSQTRDKKAIFEYGMPLCIPKTTQLIMDPANTFYPRNFQDQAYSYDKYHGYMSIPIGTPDFMVGTQVAGNLSNAPFIQYNHALPQSNTFQSPTLIDPTKASQAIFRYTGNTNNIKGHLVIPVFKAGQVNKWYQTVDQSGKRAPPTEPVNNQLQKQVVYVPAGQPHEVYSHSKLSTNDTQGYIVMPMGIPDYINWRYNNGPVNHLVPFDYRIVYDPIGRPFQVKDDQTFIEFMETAAGHRSSYFWAKTVYRRHNKRSKCIWLEPDGKFRRSRFRYIWPMAYYNVTEELGSAKETTAIARPGDTPWDPYGPPPPGDTPWDPYGPPPPGADVSKYEVKKPGDTPWDPYGPPPPGADVSKYEVKKPGDTPWDPYGPPPPGADVSKYEVKKPGDTPWDPYGPPPPGADVSKYEVKKPGDTPWDPYGPPPPGADVSKYEVKKPGDTPWDPYGPPPPGADVSKYEVKKPGDTPWDPYGPPPPGADVSKYEVKKPGDTPWDPYGPPPPGSAQVQAALKKLGTVTGPLSLYLKPGFYGQIFVPIVDLDVLDSYYATPQTRQRPSLFADVVTNSSSYYPNPTSSQTRDKKAIFEYGMPLCIPKTTQLIMDPANTFYPRNFQDQAYSYDKYHGYMSIPIGTPDFMVGTQVAGNLSNAPFIQYNHALPQSNTFQSPTLIDPTKASQAIFRYTGNTNNIKGHLVIPVFKAGQVNKWYQTVDQSGKRAPPTEPVNNQLQKQVVYVPAGQPHEVYSHSKLSTNDTQGYIVMPMGIPDYINWRYNNGPVNHLVPFDYRIVYDPIGRPFQVKDDQTFIEFMETAAGHRSSYFWAKTVYRRHNKRSKCIWLEPDGKFRRSRFRYIWPMAYYNVTEELGSAKETTAIARPGDTPWDPYGPPPPGDTPWDPYGPPPPGADVSKYEVKKPGDTPWDPYGPPPPGADVSKYEVKKPGDTPWDPYGPPPPGADVSKYEVKKPGDTPWDPYGPPPPGADVSKYEVKKPGDTPWDPYGPPPPGADVSKYEVKKPGDTPWDPYGPPPPGSAQVQAALKKLGTVTGPLSLYLKPGFYGQIFVPIVDLDVLDSYYATPQTRQRPSLFADVVTNSSSYYPNPTSSQTRDKKAIFEYGMPLCIPKTTQLIMDPANTFYPRNFQDQAYSYDKYHGYMSIPIGTPDFMVGTQVAGNLSNAPFIQYNHALPQSNTFQSPTLIDPTKASQAIFRYTGNTNNIKGHLVIPVFKAGQVNKWYQTVDQSGKRAPPTEPVNNQLQKQVVYVPAGQPHEVYSHSKLSTNDTQGYIVMPMGIPDYINWRYNNGPVNHLVPFDYRIVYDPIGRPFQVKDDQTFIEFMETAAGHRSSYFWAKTVYRRHNKRSKCIWLEPDGKFRRSRFRYIWPMAYYNVTEELGSAKETTAIARPGDTPWDPYGPPPPGDTPWDPYGPPPPGADVSKYEVKKPGDTPWDPYGPPPPGADVSKYEVKKPGDTPWDPYGPPPPGADVSKYEVKKPGDTPWYPYGPPPPGADVSKYEVKKPGDTPWDPYGPPPPGADVSKYEVKKPGDTPWDPYGPPPPGADVSKYEVKKPGDTPWDPYGPPPPGADASKYSVKKPGDTPWDPYGPPPPGADASKYSVKKPGDTPWDPYGPPPPGADASKYSVKKPGDTPWDPYGPPPPGVVKNQSKTSPTPAVAFSTGTLFHPQTKKSSTVKFAGSPTPRKYKIIQQIPIQTPNLNEGRRTNSQPHQNQSNITGQPQPLISIINPSDLIHHMESSQVRPVNTTTNSNIPINTNLIPFPASNTQYPGQILNLPGTVEHNKNVDEHGNVIETTKQSGSFVGPVDNGGSYESTYLYKSEVKEEGQGQHKITKQVTQIRTNQTVNWISRSRALENDPTAQHQVKRQESPKKDAQVKK